MILVGVHKEYHLCRLDLKFPFSFQLVKTHGLGCVKMITLLGGVKSGRKSRRRQGNRHKMKTNRNQNRNLRQREDPLRKMKVLGLSQD